MTAETEAHDDNVTRLKETVQSLKEDVAELQNRASAGLRDLKEKGQEYRQMSGEVIDSVAAYCKENPQQAALIAAATGLGVGIILGLLMRGK